MARSLLATLGFVGLLGACGVAEPRYLTPAVNLESAVDGDGVPIVARGSLTLPIVLETQAEAQARGAEAQTLGVAVPYVKLDDVYVSVEYAVKNLDVMDGTARVGLNGASELFTYDPSLLQDGDAEDPSTAPPLAGGIPVTIPAGATITGEFREDQLREASIDLDQITRGNINPFAATLVVSEDLASYQPITAPDPANPDAMPTPMGPPVPRTAFPHLVRIDMAFSASTHMVLDYQVRVRDRRGIVHEELDAAPAGELTTFNPVVYGAVP